MFNINYVHISALVLGLLTLTACSNTSRFVLPNTFGNPVKEGDTHSDADSQFKARVEEKKAMLF